MGERLVETLVGAIVLIVAGAFFFYAYTRSNVQKVSGYELQARFGSVGSLAVGSDVRISGIKVGTVTQERLDPETYLATVRMSIEPEVKVPDDSAVRIAQDGLLGDHYLVIEPGGSDQFLRAGGTIAHTQGAVDLLSLVGQAIFSAGGNKDKGGGAGPKAEAVDPLAAPPLGLPPPQATQQPQPSEPAQAPQPPQEQPQPQAAPHAETAPAQPGAPPAPEQGPAAGQQALPPQPLLAVPEH